MSLRIPGPIARRLLRAPVWLYDWNAGWVLGGRFLQLTHVGRSSGNRHRTVLEVLGTTPTGEVVVIAGLGRSADWYRNLQVHPQVDVAVRRQKFQAVARTLDEPEAITVLAGYERRDRWILPVAYRALSWLVGWSYDGTHEARRRLVRECPLVGLAPTRTR